MTIDLKTTYRQFPPPLRAKERIRGRLDQLAALRSDIALCDIVAEKMSGHQLERNEYRIAIALKLLNGDTVADHDHHNRYAHEDFFKALDHAFDALERVLRDTPAGKTPAFPTAGR